MGVIAALLFTQGYLGGEFHAPLWVVLFCHAAMAIGTLVGGWRIVHTMGARITHIKPMQGFCAELGGAITIFSAIASGTPISTTHTIAGSIAGVGLARKGSSVRWDVALDIIFAWVLTLPAAGLDRRDRLRRDRPDCLTTTDAAVISNGSHCNPTGLERDDFSSHRHPAPAHW